MDYITVSAKTLDDALTEALVELGVTSDQLDYEVIEKGSAGFLGIGAKQAVIKARKKIPQPKVEEEKVEKEFKQEIKKEEAVKEIKETKSSEVVAVQADTAEVTTQFIKDVLKAMNMEEVNVTSKIEDEGMLSIDMEGSNMGILIGKRGQTLDSLQYLANRVANKNQEGYVRVKLDTEDYRKRRKDTLENLAKNIASKVKRTRRSVSLEPMNPYERRIIHSALQGDPGVDTHSEGNEPYRKVVVTYVNSRR
ncbi:spoIIIJ-associated protein [Aequitasia blattaphilus]|uniref:RNA-binding protein KhpB n=1 Tax=Aequitasia blattaphilus TaxID=2949332 RepID=A0ABT1EB96_9FIRM|nr:RNA-binding cell elongation regulator Jag/EloR [Aequitasia blattaphilus]MCP1103110.1 protein jag [Aequitasia blattaphilus]MCR8615750.1 protein jag [Aequitasia blattaphilus]